MAHVSCELIRDTTGWVVQTTRDHLHERKPGCFGIKMWHARHQGRTTLCKLIQPTKVDITLNAVLLYFVFLSARPTCQE